MSREELVKSVTTIIEMISPNRFTIIKVSNDNNNLRIYVKPNTIDLAYLETDALVYDLIWHIENAVNPNFQ